MTEPLHKLPELTEEQLAADPRIGMRRLAFEFLLHQEYFGAEAWHGLPNSQRAGILLHETSHVFQSFGSWHRTDFNAIDVILHKPGGYEKLVKLCRCEDEQSTWAKEQHGASFVRYGLHLQRRSGVPLHSINIFAEQYGSPDHRLCLAALDDELTQGGNLDEILKSDPPEKFAALFA